MNDLRGRLISVVIPVYRVEEYLRLCIESVLSQTHPAIEVILVDDGSPDNCGKICDEYAKKDHRVRVVHQSNAGLSAARNAGIGLATGDYIGFVDSDDWIEPEMYEKLLALLESENADITQCGVKSDGLDQSSTNTADITVYGNHGMLRASIEGNISGTVWCNLYKREIWTDLRYLEGHYYEDALIMPMLSEKCNKFVRTSERLYHYNRRAGGILRRPKEMLHLESKEKLFETYRKYFGGHPELAQLGAYYFLKNIPAYRSAILPNGQISRKAATAHNRKMHALFLGYWKQSRQYPAYRTEPMGKRVFWMLYAVCPSGAIRIQHYIKKFFGK